MLHLADAAASIADHTSSVWSSLSFTGNTHLVTVVFDGDENILLGEDFIQALPEHEFSIPGQLVADAHVTDVITQPNPPSLTVVCKVLLLAEDQ